MKLNKIIVIAFGCTLGALSLEAYTMQPTECSAMSPEIQRFAGELTPLNRKMFCENFTDGQRASAMQMVSEPDESGVVMTPDLAVQKVAKANRVDPQQKSSRGCPMK